MTNDLTTGKPLGVIWRFSVPLLLSTALQQIYNIADSIIVGQYTGAAGLAAIGAAYPITLFYIAFATGAAMGCSVIISQLFGARKMDRLKAAVFTGLPLPLPTVRQRSAQRFIPAAGASLHPGVHRKCSGHEPDVRQQGHLSLCRTGLARNKLRHDPGTGYFRPPGLCLWMTTTPKRPEQASPLRPFLYSYSAALKLYTGMIRSRMSTVGPIWEMISSMSL